MLSANWPGPITPRQVLELAIESREVVKIITMGRVKPLRNSQPRGAQGRPIRTKSIMIMHPSKFGYKPNTASSMVVDHPCVTNVGLGAYKP